MWFQRLEVLVVLFVVFFTVSGFVPAVSMNVATWSAELNMYVSVILNFFVYSFFSTFIFAGYLFVDQWMWGIGMRKTKRGDSFQGKT